MATNKFGDTILEKGELAPEDIEAVYNKFGDLIAPVEGPSGKEPSQTPAEFAYESKILKAPTGYRLIENYVRPSMQALGSGGGFIIGAGAGSAAPGVGTVAGGVAGGGFGYTIADEIVDIFNQMMGYSKPLPFMLEMEEASQDLAMGLGGEMAGPMIGPIGRGITRLPGVRGIIPKTKGQVEQEVGKMLTAFTDKGPIMVKSVEEAKALEDLIPGLKFDLGQLTGEADVVRFMKEGVEDAGDLAVARAQRTADNTKAINDFIKKMKGGKEGAEQLKDPLAKQKAALSEAEEIAKFNMEEQKLALKPSTKLSSMGEDITKQMEAGRLSASELAGKKFAEVPKQDIIIDDVYDEINKIMQKLHESEGPKKFPGAIKRWLDVQDQKMKGLIDVEPPKPGTVPDDIKAQAEADIAKAKGKPIPKPKPKEPEGPVELTTTLKDLHGFRSELLEDLRLAKRKDLSPTMRKRMADAVKIIDQKLLHSGEGGAKLKEAQKFFKENVVEKYDKGVIGEILKGQEVIESADIAPKIFRPGGKGEQATQRFMAIMGDNPKAQKAMKDYVNYSLYDNVYSDKTGTINKGALNKWLRQHEGALKNLGMENDFSSISKVNDALEIAVANSKEFEKSAANRVLKGDTKDIVKNALRADSKEQAAKELVSQVEGNEKALKGLQNEMIDEILTLAPLEKEARPLLTSSKVAEHFRKYDPALKVVFKNDKEKLAAMHNVRRAVKTLEYQTKEALPEGIPGAVTLVQRLALIYGHSAYAAADIAKKAGKALKGVNKKRINKLYNKAVFDPNIAWDLIKAAKGGSEEKIKSALVPSLAKAGLWNWNKNKPKED